MTEGTPSCELRGLIADQAVEIYQLRRRVVEIEDQCRAHQERATKAIMVLNRMGNRRERWAEAETFIRHLLADLKPEEDGLPFDQSYTYRITQAQMDAILTHMNKAKTDEETEA